MAAPVEARIEKMKIVMERIKLAQDNKDYTQIPQVCRDFDDATGP
jgi:hypothetical protein